MTNADHIRNMTDKELAELLCIVGWRLGQVAECEEWLKQPSEFTEVFRVQEIENAPTIEAETVKHGRWVCHEIEDTLRWKECSECKCEIPNVSYNYCPNCGSKMDLEEK